MQRCQRETTSNEFVEWQTYFRQEQNEPRREEYYLAQIVLEIRRIFAKNPNALKLDDFLFKFDVPAPTKKAKEAKAAASKKAWLAITGIGKKVQTRTPPSKKQ